MSKPNSTCSQPVVSSPARRELQRTVRHRGVTSAVLLVAIISLALALQGWKSRIPAFDMLTTIHAAQALIDTGHLPDRGVLSSFLSFTPPGAAWLIAPGVWAFKDPRLFELPGSVALFIGTLFGIYFLARRYFGVRCAVLAVLLYGLSDLGLRVASTVEFRYAIQCFFIWMIYWAARWAEENRAGFLAASLVTWVAGMYVFMEMAPAIFVIPAMWLAYKPSVRIAPIVLAGLVAAVIWDPYLQFERNRGFADLSSQIRRERIGVTFHESWCEPALAPADWWRNHATASGSPTTSKWRAAKQWMSEKAGLIAGELLLTNFRNSRVPGASLILFLLTAASCVLFLVGSATRRVGDSDTWHHGLTWIAIGTALTALIVNEFTVARYVTPDGALDRPTASAIRIFQTVLLIAALVLVVCRKRVAPALQSAVGTWRSSVLRASPAPGLIILGLTIPWAMLLLLSEAERRLWWIWPLQVVALAAAATYVPSRLGMSRWVVRVGSVAVFVFVAANTVLLSRIEGWARHGWSGRDAVEIDVTDRIAARMKGRRENQAAIGYDVDFWRFMATFNVADSRYKVGADFDMLFRYRHGIANLNRCAEGVSPHDEYRIVQTVARDDDPSNKNRIVSTMPGTFDMTDRVGAYEIYRRR